MDFGLLDGCDHQEVGLPGALPLGEGLGGDLGQPFNLSFWVKKRNMENLAANVYTLCLNIVLIVIFFFSIGK